MKLTKPRFFIVLAIITFLSCQEDPEITQELSFVDSALKPYFDRFISEGLQRGVLFGTSFYEIEGHIAGIGEENIVGQCSSGPGGRTITIDSGFWHRASDFNREYLVFHELGHCFLNRIHLDDKNANGTCVSIMQSGKGLCRSNYNRLTRMNYLDELFSQ